MNVAIAPGALAQLHTAGIDTDRLEQKLRYPGPVRYRQVDDHGTTTADQQHTLVDVDGEEVTVALTVLYGRRGRTVTHAEVGARRFRPATDLHDDRCRLCTLDGRMEHQTRPYVDDPGTADPVVVRQVPHRVCDRCGTATVSVQVAGQVADLVARCRTAGRAWARYPDGS